MKRLFAHYTLIRLLPLADAGEFANIGVVLACPDTGYFGFRLMKRQRRVTEFFQEITRDLLTKLRKELTAELAHVRDFVATRQATAELAQVMQDLAKPRETMIRYAPLRGLMTEDPAADLDKLFERYVHRDLSVAPQYHEQILVKLVKRTLAMERLADAFEANDVGTDDFHIRLPFVHERGGQAVAAIKPLDLTQDEPTKIYTHGDLWLGHFRRLKALNLRPQGLLVAAEGPLAEDVKRFRAYNDILDELRQLDVSVVDRADARGIVEFARAYVQ
ncbi:DUF3037 domain-containing protein [Rhodoferax sp.]|uniref:DUF3037 domain-containing protein n=1 Tax=Rhodoferax sp. TaxID=50421 RepID=UPI00274F2CC3|nr:DUF3037 domain-containing protein [Rhodoferax sp.]